MSDTENSESEDVVAFDSFRLFRTKRLVEMAGVPLHLGGRALDILIALVERAGEVVSKRDLIERVWPDATVDEGSLRFHVAALRKALGDGQAGARYVSNVPGRGYCFVAPISHSNSRKRAAFEGNVAVRAHNLPPRLMRMVGRAETVLTISDQLASHRFVTIVGPGGIGKTTLAISVGHALLAEFDGNVCFVDLGTLSDPRLVAIALASALDVPVHSDPISSLVDFLRNERILIVLDSCEHVIDAVSKLAERIFEGASGAHLLATSREPLRVEGEHVHRLFPLDYPPEGMRLTPTEALDFPAVQLFVERVAATTDSFVLGDADAPVVADICRKLDGMALAIELAAGRVDTYGLHEVSALLDRRINLLWRGRRTAPPRHQTLNATLDWSYDLLSEPERAVLRRLSVFAGAFTLNAARSVVSDDDTAAVGGDSMYSLVAKSLVTADIDRPVPRYRLLGVTRAYALARLSESGEMNDVARRHANYYRDSLNRKNSGQTDANGATQVDAYADQIGNIRAGLEWGFSSGDNIAFGVALAAAAAPLLLSLSLWQECERWTEMAIAALDDTTRGTQLEMTLQASRGMSLLSRWSYSEALGAAFTRSLEIAENLGETAQQLRLLYHLCIVQINVGNARGALELALKSKALINAGSDPLQAALADCTLALTNLLIGDQANAHLYCEAALARAATLSPGNIGSFEIDIFSQTRCALSEILWLRGFPDQALAVAKRAIEVAEATENFSTWAASIIWTTRVFQWSGEWTTREYLIDRLNDELENYPTSIIKPIITIFRGEILVNRGNIDDGVELLRKRLDYSQGLPLRIESSIALTSALIRLGNFEEALTIIDRAIEEENLHGESFRTPEVLRLKGDVLAMTPGADPAEAEELLLRSGEIARAQSALSWELQAATSLASLWRKQGRSNDARNMLTSVYARFTEGFNTRDLTTAKRLLDELT
jgi:predicted ATPase/DNA-binding winged helix-turn-helix (wHTH) protein